jgi:two-component system, NtrC family, sensor histidine kinase HydH
VELLPSLPEAPVAASLDRDQFLSMLTNLLFNALDVTPPGGRVSLTLALAPDGGFRIDIADNGPGIAPAVMEKLFMPFVTTKPTGTGLGLTMARRVARAHGGALTASNREQGGACFTLTLPRTGETHA